ncbi:hypothetical protein ACFZBU_38195 [Embleya sp. NPDC008237]|uniref:hypothetical protein n=1 Tax=Embleya sp. NPDC008237 TaxID=3363978 RepID=UPI0036F035EE
MSAPGPARRTYPGAHLPICATCGTQYAGPRPDCPVCQDERRYVPDAGRQWTTLAELQAAGHTAKFAEHGRDVLGIGTTGPTTRPLATAEPLAPSPLLAATGIA